MDIKYKIQFYSNWHCGSGLSAGADVDLLVIKDKNGLPFVPGKTIKGLVREALTDIKEFSHDKRIINIDELLGKLNSKGQQKVETEPTTIEENQDDMQQGVLFFSNATLNKDTANEIIKSNTAEYLYTAISSTAIEEDGVAKDHSLRRMEVTVPCELEGCIYDVPESSKKDIEDALKYIKRLGQNRNRGLGRCDISIVETK